MDHDITTERGPGVFHEPKDYLVTVSGARSLDYGDTTGFASR